MRRRNPWILVLALAAGLQLAGCTGTSSADESEGSPPAALEAVEGSELARVILTPQAAKRLDIHTAPVTETGGAESARTAIPYAAIVYDAEGKTWAYARPEPLTFVRVPITVDRIDGDEALLVDGPPTGTEVVTVGVAELYGTELEIE
jgi:hypothetical protein